jgi:hypothetical protein
MKLELTEEVIKRLERPVGGSLNTITVTDDLFTKGFEGAPDGPLSYGALKLLRELTYIKSLTPSAAKHFPKPTRFAWDMRTGTAALVMERSPWLSLTTNILLDRLTPEEAARKYEEITTWMVTDLFPEATGSTSGRTCYEKNHAGRMRKALPLLREAPELATLLDADTVTVNGTVCPSLTRTVEFMDENVDRIFQAVHRLVRVHGDGHPQNMLVCPDGPGFLLCDPRGDLSGPPHYDPSKAWKVFFGGYDLAMNGFAEVASEILGGRSVIDLEIDGSRRAHYEAMAEVLLRWIPAYADAEGLTPDQFRLVMLASAVAHMVSLLAFHANRPEGRDPKRVLTLAAITALMAERLMRVVAGELDVADAISRPFDIWGLAAA